eukprot:2087741-Rhodomonas_salina.1
MSGIGQTDNVTSRVPYQKQEEPDRFPALVDAVAQVRAVGEAQHGERGQEQQADHDGGDGVEEEHVLVGGAGPEAREPGKVGEVETKEGGVVQEVRRLPPLGA